MRLTDSRTVYRLQRILDVLLERDIDQKQLTERICMSDPRQVGKYLNHLHSKNKAHICGWRDPGSNGHRWPVWRIGKGCNVEKPAAKTHAELMSDYWRRQGRGSTKKPTTIACPFGALFKLQEQRA